MLEVSGANPGLLVVRSAQGFDADKIEINNKPSISYTDCKTKRLIKENPMSNALSLFKSHVLEGQIALQKSLSHSQVGCYVMLGSPDKAVFLEDHVENAIDELMDEQGYEGKDKDVLIQAFQDTLKDLDRFDLQTWLQPKELDALPEETLPDAVGRQWSHFAHLNTGQSRPEVLVAQLPISEPWQIPLYLRFGDWNTCPEPLVHAALLKDWQSRFGARVIGVSGSEIELKVATLPSPNEALALAQTQIQYCDTLGDNTVDLQTLATQLCQSQYWYFWWN